MGGTSVGSSLGRWLRQYPNGELYSYLIAALFVVAVIAYFVFVTMRDKKVASAGKYRLVTLLADSDAAHLLHESVPDPAGIRSRLRAFNTATEVYDYVYKKFDEPLYKRFLLHLPGSEPTEFDHDPRKSHDDNLAGLTAHLSKG